MCCVCLLVASIHIFFTQICSFCLFGYSSPNELLAIFTFSHCLSACIETHSVTDPEQPLAGQLELTLNCNVIDCQLK